MKDIIQKTHVSHCLAMYQPLVHQETRPLLLPVWRNEAPTTSALRRFRRRRRLHFHFPSSGREADAQDQVILGFRGDGPIAVEAEFGGPLLEIGT